MTAPDAPLVSIVALNWDHYDDLTGPFIHAIDTWTARPFELVVVDQGSNERDRCQLKRAAAHRDWLRVVQLEENVGFPGGCNVGARDARGEVVVFMNNDILIHGDWLTPIRQVLASEPKAVVGCSLVRRGGWNEFRLGNGREVVVPYLEGWLLAVRREFLEEVGFFDEAFGKGSMEDVELCWRAVRAGYELVALSLPLVHLRGRTVMDGRLDQPRITSANYELMKARVEAFERGAP
jgi:GT2 family glycosyltransferase